MDQVVVFGRGFLGHRIAAALQAPLDPANIADADAVTAALDRHRATVVINAAGKTGRPNVDWCETHQSETYRSNTLGPLVLADVCATRGAYLLHLASGCIFYGPSPSPNGWREDDHANPVAFYSRTKYAADLVLSRLPHVAIARLRMPIDGSPGPRNLITKLAGYERVVDVANSVTVVDDLISAVRQLVDLRAEGTFHVTNPGVLRHRELLAMYQELVDPFHSCTFIDEEALLTSGLVAKVRSNCILESSRLAALGVRLRPVHDAVRETMIHYARVARTAARA